MCESAPKESSNQEHSHLGTSQRIKLKCQVQEQKNSGTMSQCILILQEHIKPIKHLKDIKLVTYTYPASFSSYSFQIHLCRR